MAVSFLMTIALTLLSYLSGSLMFSFWLGKLKNVDIRNFGDGNPGAINAFKGAGWGIGIISLLLDYLKGFLPVYLVYQVLGITDIRLIPIAIAPVLGHAFSPFLRFRGGKSIAVTFGIWSGLTLWEGPTLLGTIYCFLKFIVKTKNDGWGVLIGMGGLLIYVLFRHPNSVFIAIFSLNALVLVIKHWQELRNR